MVMLTMYHSANDLAICKHINIYILNHHDVIFNYAATNMERKIN